MKTKATCIILWAFLLLTANLFSQAPQKFNYQAVVRDDAGNIVPDQAVGIKISILQNAVDGTVVYSETHLPTTNSFGLVTIEIGDGTVISGDLSLIDWGLNTYFMKVELDATGGTTYSDMGTSQILSVPFALHAKTAEEVDDADANPTNELQVLSFSNDTLYLSTGGYVYLGFYADTQRLVLNDFYLHITDGNEIELPTLWERWGNDIRYDSGRVQIGTLNGEVQLELIDVFGSGGRNLVIGDDSYLTDLDVLNTLGIFGNSDTTLASVKLGAEGPTITGKNGFLGISNADPLTELDVNGVITATDGTSTEWNEAYGWGDHSTAGYLTSYTESDPIFEAWDKSTGISITESQITDLNHFTTADETDPVFGAHAANGITSTNITNWTTAYGWGDHSTVGYFAAGGEAGGSYRTLGNIDDYSLGFKTNDATRLFITNDGNVGIGTISPSRKLEIYDNVNSDVTLKIRNASTGNNVSERISFGTPEAAGIWVFGPNYTGNENVMRFLNNRSGGSFDFITGATNRMAIASNGNVGIGTGSPTYPLEMGSGAHVTAGGVWTDASSKEYKENIRDLTIEEAKAALEGLKPTRFNYKVDKEDDYLGFIAEDVPELVASKDRKGLSPMDIVAVLTKMVQAQQKKIEELEALLKDRQ